MGSSANSGLSVPGPLLLGTSNEIPRELNSPPHRYNTTSEGLRKILGIYGLYLEFFSPLTKSFSPLIKLVKLSEDFGNCCQGCSKVENFREVFYQNKIQFMFSVCYQAQTSNPRSDLKVSRCSTFAVSDIVSTNHMWALKFEWILRVK